LIRSHGAAAAAAARYQCGDANGAHEGPVPEAGRVQRGGAEQPLPEGGAADGGAGGRDSGGGCGRAHQPVALRGRCQLHLPGLCPARHREHQHVSHPGLLLGGSRLLASGRVSDEQRLLSHLR